MVRYRESFWRHHKVDGNFRNAIRTVRSMVHQNQTAADMIDRSAVIREFSRGVGTPTNKEMKTNSEEGQVEESSKQVPMNPTTKANKQEESSQRNLLSPHKIACIQIEQLEQKKRVQPPCHCHSCSAFFWFAGADSPSLVALEKGKAAADVQLWTENSLKKSKDIRRGLTQYGATLRKRWTKKFSSTKGQHIKLLANVQAALKERDAGNEMEESAWFTMTEPFGSNARARMLTTALNPDHLLECPENLFEQFENRSKHPSQLFYADYHCMYSVSAHRTTLRHSFIPGAFNVTVEKYGQWQDWHDEEVHRFQAVAASVSYLVFESQSEIMNVLWEFSAIWPTSCPYRIAILFRIQIRSKTKLRSRYHCHLSSTHNRFTLTCHRGNSRFKTLINCATIS